MARGSESDQALLLGKQPQVSDDESSGRRYGSTNTSNGSWSLLTGVDRSRSTNNDSHSVASAATGTDTRTDSSRTSDREAPGFRASCAYKYTPIQSKGGILVLVWNFLVFSSVSGIYSVLLSSVVEHVSFIPNGYAWTLTIVSIVRAVVWISYPLFGWLADTYFGRYKTLLYGMRIIWIGSMMLLVCDVVFYLLSSSRTLDHIFYHALYPVIFIAVSIGLAGYQAIVIPFGTDQMPGASSNQLSAFILWYFWTEYFSFGIVYSYLLSCRNNTKVVTLIQSILQLVFITVALVLNQLFRKTLDIERAGGNPLGTIWGVLKFAKKNKFPQQRSAFTYWEDTMPSRLDLAKRRYGGTYTTEQVEDVKTFFRIIAVLCTTVVSTSAYVAMDSTTGELLDRLKHSPHVNSSTCYAATTIDNFQIHIIIIAVPLYHFLIQPFIRNYVPTTLQRLRLGFVLFTMALLITVVIETIGYATTSDKDDLACLLTARTHDPKMDVDYRWLLVPKVISGLGYIVSGSAVLEFVYAQSPHAMKGFLLGAAFSMYGVASAVGFLILLTFHQTFGHHHLPNDPMGCGFWYYLTNLVISIVGLLAIVCVTKWYKLRKRDDLSFEPIHVEHYYETKN